MKLYSALFLISTSLFAAEKPCELRVDLYIDENDVEVGEQTFVAMKNTWQECFEIAVYNAQKLDYSSEAIQYIFTKPVGRITVYPFINWSFKESFFSTKKGQVNKHAAEYLKEPKVGPYIFNTHGLLFKF